MGTLGGTGRHKLHADLVLTKRLGLRLVYDWSILGLHLVYMQQPRHVIVKNHFWLQQALYMNTKQPPPPKKKAEHSATGYMTTNCFTVPLSFWDGTDR